MATQVTDIQSALTGVDYPASKDQLISQAEDNSAPQNVIEELRALDGDTYEGPDHVMRALGREEGGTTDAV